MKWMLAKKKKKKKKEKERKLIIDGELKIYLALIEDKPKRQQV